MPRCPISCARRKSRSCRLTPEELGVDVTPRLVTLKVEEPAKRQGGIKVGSVGETGRQAEERSAVI